MKTVGFGGAVETDAVAVENIFRDFQVVKIVFVQVMRERGLKRQPGQTQRKNQTGKPGQGRQITTGRALAGRQQRCETVSHIVIFKFDPPGPHFASFRVPGLRLSC